MVIVIKVNHGVEERNTVECEQIKPYSQLVVRASTVDLRVDFNKNIARHAIASYDLAVGQLQRFPCKI